MVREKKLYHQLSFTLLWHRKPIKHAIATIRTYMLESIRVSLRGNIDLESIFSHRGLGAK